MSKVIPATCSAGVVLVDGIPLDGVVIQSEGVAQSDGIAILDEEKSFYLAKTSPDLKATLEKILEALTEIKGALSEISDGPVTVAGSGAGPTLPALQTLLNARISAITTVETELNTLKGALL